MARRSPAQPPGKPRLGAAALIALLAAGCQPAPTAAPSLPLSRVPPFATTPYEPFSRAETVAIALREWHAWGDRVDDAAPDGRPEPLAQNKPERQPGLWQRVGEYWWTGQDPGNEDGAWTGKHDAAGHVFPASEDEDYAWSAAFISYVMRIAGAGPRFPYAPNHATYINLARQASLGQVTGLAISAEPIDTTAPAAGDLICMGRNRARSLRLEDLPAGRFPGHCDIVISVAPSQLAVIGGNVFDAVTMRHVPITDAGTLAPPNGPALDTRYPWFVVIRVHYDE